MFKTKRYTEIIIYIQRDLSCGRENTYIIERNNLREIHQMYLGDINTFRRNEA